MIRSFLVLCAFLVTTVAQGATLCAELRREIALTGFIPRSVDYAPDQSRLAVSGLEGGMSGGRVSLSAAGSVLLLDAPRFTKKIRLAEGSWPASVRFLRDGAVAAVVSATLTVWDAKGKQRFTRGDVESVAYAADGALATVRLADGS